MELAAFELPTLEHVAPPAPMPEPGSPAHEADLDAIREAARQEGRQQGLAEARAHLTSAMDTVREAVDALHAERARTAELFEGGAVDLALRIAEQALGAAVEVKPERVVDVVRGALRRLVDRERVTILVNPADLDFVREAQVDLISELGGIEHCEVQAERRVGPGGAVVRTQEGEVDASLTTKLARAREILMEEFRG